MSPAIPNDDTTKIMRKQTEANLAALHQEDRTGALVEMRLHELTKTLQSFDLTLKQFQAQMAETDKIQAITSMQVKELAKDMAETDSILRRLQSAEERRADREERMKELAQPKQYNVGMVAAITATVTVAINAVAVILFYLVKHVPGVSP